MWFLLITAAATCFGVGIGVAVAFPLAATLLIGRARLPAAGMVTIWSIPVVVAVAYVAIQRSVMIHDMPVLKAVMMLATSGRVVFAMWWDLVAYGTYALATGPFVSAAFFVTRPGIVVAGAAVAALALVIALAPSGKRERLLAIALLALGAYGVIAAGRAALYSSLGGDVVQGSTEGRYHYVGQLFLAVLLAHGLVAVGRTLTPRLRAVAYASVLGIVVLGFAVRRPAIDHHDDVRVATREAVALIDADVAAARAAHPDAPSVTIENRLFWPALFPEFVGTAGLFVIWYPTDVLQDRRSSSPRRRAPGRPPRRAEDVWRRWCVRLRHRPVRSGGVGAGEQRAHPAPQIAILGPGRGIAFDEAHTASPHRVVRMRQREERHPAREAHPREHRAEGTRTAAAGCRRRPSSRTAPRRSRDPLPPETSRPTGAARRARSSRQSDRAQATTTSVAHARRTGATSRPARGVSATASRATHSARTSGTAAR